MLVSIAIGNIFSRVILKSFKNQNLLIQNYFEIMKAKKSFGQHFLNDEGLAARIANSLKHTDQYSKVLEVGPGRAMLTKYLLEQPYELKVVEADRDMVAFLSKNYPQLDGRIIADDFLKIRLEEHMGNCFGVIGNFPYNISSQILFKVVACREFVPEVVGMFQKEVAERVVSKPGNKTYGVISVLIQAFYEGEYLFTVKQGSFTPPPKVLSGVIRLTRKTNQDLGCDYKLFRQVVKMAFSQRRKMLRNTMKSFLKGQDILKDEFFTQRPERLSVEDFVQLTKWVAEHRG